MSEYVRKANTSCLICRKAIYRRPSQIKLNNGRSFCSSVCYGISNQILSPCVVCGKLIPAHFNKKTCSRECSNKNRTGIKYKQESQKDKVKNYFILKMRLSDVRGKACERCGYLKFEILQVHHKDRNRENNVLENLELICPNCHSEEHYLSKALKRQAISNLD